MATPLGENNQAERLSKSLEASLKTYTLPNTFWNLRHIALFPLHIFGPIEAWHKWQLIGPINLPRHKIAEGKISTSKQARAVDIKGE